MSLFDKLNNKRYDLQEIKKKGGPNYTGRVNFDNNENSDNENEIEIDKKKRKDDYIKQQAKKANTTPSELKRRFKGATYDDEPFSKTPRKFDTPYTSKSGNKKISPSFFDKRQEFQIGDDGRPSKEAVKQRLKGRIISQSKRKIEQGNKLDIKTAADVNTKKKLIQKGNRYLEDPKRLDKLVNRVAKNQKLSTATGKKSSLFKTLKKYSDVTNPTIKGASGGKLPMPGGYDVDGGRTGTAKQQKSFDAKVQKGKDKFFNTNKKFGNVGREFDLQFKADKLRLDAGGRIAAKDPKIAKMTVKQKKANYEKVKAAIDKKNPTFKSPISGGKLPVTPENMKKYKVNKQGFTKGQAFKKFASKQGGKAFKYLKGAAARNPLVAGALAVGAGALAYNRIKKALAGPTLKDKDFTATKPIQDRSGKNVKFTYGKDAKDKAMPYLTKSSLKKFKTGEYKVATKSGANYNVNDRIKNSAFEKQLQKAEKNPNKNKNKDFLKKFKNATRPT